MRILSILKFNYYGREYTSVFSILKFTESENTKFTESENTKYTEVY